MGVTMAVCEACGKGFEPEDGPVCPRCMHDHSTDGGPVDDADELLELADRWLDDSDDIAGGTEAGVLTASAYAACAKELMYYARNGEHLADNHGFDR